MQTELEQHKKEIPRVQEKCPECGSANLVNDYKMGETVCSGCGLVLHEQMMDKGPEWRAFTQEEKLDRSRVGIPTSYSEHDKGLPTAIGRVDRDYLGRKLPLDTRLQMWRLRKWQITSSVQSNKDRNIAYAMGELNRLTERVQNIPHSVREKASVYYRKAVDLGLVRGRSIVAVAAAALYAGCRATGTPRTLKEIAEASLADKKDIARYYRLLLKEDVVHNVPIQNPNVYFERLGIKGQTEGIATKISEAAKELKIHAGKSPYIQAAAAGYIASIFNNKKITQRVLAERADTNEVSIRNNIRIFNEKLYFIIPV